MSQYTTGELARRCGVSVRTVQYYDTRGILIPSAVSDGGQRLYTEQDVHRLQVICFLRSLGLSIDTIGELLSDACSGTVVALLLDQQADQLRREIADRREQLDTLEALRSAIADKDQLTVESLHDIAYIMKNKNKLRRVHTIMLAIGIGMDIIELGTLFLWIRTGIWWPFALGMAAVIALGVWVCTYYYRHTAFLCPACHRVFRPGMREVLFAHHTPRTRKLTCPHCGHVGFCVETFAEDAQ